MAIKTSLRDKKDLDVTVLDNYIGGEETYGLSVKSDLGSSPTLLNTTVATQFEYEATGLDEVQECAIAAITAETVGKRRWLLERATALRERGAQIRLVAVKKTDSRRNLLIFDDYLFHATRFETPSTKRTDILNLRRVGDAWRFSLTLQIRFR